MAFSPRSCAKKCSANGHLVEKNSDHLPLMQQLSIKSINTYKYLVMTRKMYKNQMCPFYHILVCLYVEHKKHNHANKKTTPSSHTFTSTTQVGRFLGPRQNRSFAKLSSESQPCKAQWLVFNSATSMATGRSVFPT